MARQPDLRRHINKRGDFMDLSVGVGFYEEGGLLFATLQFAATKGTRRKHTSIRIDLNEALQQFAQDLPRSDKGEAPLQKPVPIADVSGGT